VDKLKWTHVALKLDSTNVTLADKVKAARLEY